ncbi:MAG: LON peptidase substrate-binding domain-containing protein [Phycisphaerae bacterium]
MNVESVHVPPEVPVFPLPDVVLFPRQILPLHIFEPRYRKMVADVLAGDQFMAVALLRTGYEDSYLSASAPIHSVIGVGRIIGSERLDDGRYNILLRGEARAKIVDEQPARPYRVANIEPLACCCDSDVARSADLRGELRIVVESAFGDVCEAREQLEQLLTANLPLTDLVDLIAAGMPAPGEVRQVMLEELDVTQRLQLLIDNIRTTGALLHQSRLRGGRGSCHLN